jgi:hypothetical protein
MFLSLLSSAVNIPNGWIVTDPMTFYMFMFMLFGLGFAVGIFILIYLFRKVPETLVLVRAYFGKKVLIADCSDVGPVDFLPTKPMSEGQFEVSPYNFKVLPRLQNPLRARFWLRKSKIPILWSYTGTTAAVAADILAAIEIADTPKKEDIPNDVKAFAKTHYLDFSVDVEKKTREKDPDNSRKFRFIKKTVKETVTESLFALDPRKLKTYFTEHYDPTQFRNLLKEHYQSGWEDGHGTKPKGFPKWLPLAIFGIVMIVLIVIVIVAGGGKI